MGQGCSGLLINKKIGACASGWKAALPFGRHMQRLSVASHCLPGWRP